MRRAAAWGFAVGTLAAAHEAGATGSTAFAETSRVASLADAVSARPGDAGSMLMNPAGLADVTEPVVVLAGQFDHLSQWFARTNEPQTDLGRSFGAFGFAAATPLPGPWWLQRVRVGLGLDLPAQYVLQVDVPQRVDQPTSPIYDSRPNRVSALTTLAIDFAKELKVGGGVSLTPSLTTPTTVAFVPGRTTSIQNDVTITLERDMPLAASPFLGVRSQALSWLGLALVYRGSAVSNAGGNQTTTAGPILANSPVDYLIFWDPAELVAGAALGPFKGWSLSVDATYSEWSAFRTGFDQEPTPAFKNTVSVAGGVEWTSTPWLTLRAGGGYEPSPIPPQTADTNYLGADTVVLALGAGLDLRRLLHAPLVVDFHIRGRLGSEQTAVKNPASLSDSDPNTPGKQIDNLGYPGFQSQSSLYQAGLTLTLFVGKEKNP
jgi:outer membrane protein transport protein (OMPP1/FadL/TodX)